MKGDFSRIGFDAANRFSRVLSQQGRVTLDSDANEQVDILLHLLRTLTRDVFGPFGGPKEGGGFRLQLQSPAGTAVKSLGIGAGHYYVDGILCECDGCEYIDQPDYDPAAVKGDPLLLWLTKGSGGPFWVYLDVWERHITWIEQDSIREVALGSGAPDTCTRSKVVWQVKALPWDSAWGAASDCTKPLSDPALQSTAQMAAQLSAGAKIKDPCSIAPDAQYRGAENHLYRVEIHQGGTADEATFKWSRDNGSVATRWLGTDGSDLIVTNTRGFDARVWVELSDDALDLNGEPGSLVMLANVKGDRLSVDPSTPSSAVPALTTSLSNPKVRRWDQSANDNTVLSAGAIPIVESADPGNPQWIDLEDGIQVWFKQGGIYRTGDYWLIPARVVTGTIEWPPDAHNSLLKTPTGVEHHYAPLGIISAGAAVSVKDCLVCKNTPIVACVDVSAPAPAPGPAPTPAPVPPAHGIAHATKAPAKPKRKGGPA